MVPAATVKNSIKWTSSLGMHHARTSPKNVTCAICSELHPVGSEYSKWLELYVRAWTCCINNVSLGVCNVLHLCDLLIEVTSKSAQSHTVLTGSWSQLMVGDGWFGMALYLKASSFMPGARGSNHICAYWRCLNRLMTTIDHDLTNTPWDLSLLPGRVRGGPPDGLVSRLLTVMSISCRMEIPTSNCAKLRRNYHDDTPPIHPETNRAVGSDHEHSE